MHGLNANYNLNYDLSSSQRKEDEVWGETRRHYQIGYQETDRRRIGRLRVGSISFDEADELFRSWVNETTWPYDALLFDPRVFTFIFEKTSRLIASKPRGKLIPRHQTDVASAEINNALLDYQWDQANRGGPMLAKWAMMDMNCRKYGAAFGLCLWRYQADTKGNVVFDGPEFKLVNNRDVAHDLTATAIEDANWLQIRQYPTFQELESVNDHARKKPVYKNMDRLRQAIGRDEADNISGGDRRSANWLSRNRAISRLELDPIGKDPAFKTVEVVTEYRRDRWITFAPKHGVVIRDMLNPYQNDEIPITMLKYYAIDDDIYGLSEIEPVKGLQKAINALLCQYVDEINQALYSPIAIGPGVRQHTLRWGKGERWIMNNPMTDFRLVESNSRAAQYFNNTYSVLVSAFMNAIGESSLGTSNIEPMQQVKTATEVKALQLQKNARDNFNQIFLAEAIKRNFMLWHTMNSVMLFADKDPKQQQYLLRIVGKDKFGALQKQGLGDNMLPQQSAEFMLAQGITDPQEQQKYIIPKYPVNTGTKAKPEWKPKLQVDQNSQTAQLILQPEDLQGLYDFTVDVESMAVNADDQRRQARQGAISLITTNPTFLSLLQQEGVRPKFKELFIDYLEDLGFVDADKYFEPIPQQEMEAMQQGKEQKPPAVSINYRDLSPDLQAQAAQEAGLQPPQGSQSGGMGGAMGGGMGGGPPAGGESMMPPMSSMAEPNPMSGLGLMNNGKLPNPLDAAQNKPEPSIPDIAGLLKGVVNPKIQREPLISQNLGQPNPHELARLYARFGGRA